MPGRILALIVVKGPSKGAGAEMFVSGSKYNGPGPFSWPLFPAPFLLECVLMREQIIPDPPAKETRET